MNHLQGKQAAASAQDVVGAVYSLLAEGHLDESQFANLRVHLDWVQYRQNFREAVTVTQCMSDRSDTAPAMEIRVDTRQVVPGALREQMLQAIASANPIAQASAGSASERLYLEDFTSFRSSIAWEFNKLYWHRLSDWEQATGKGYEQALPGGKSDANHPEAIADCVADFWTLLRDLENKNQLPPEVFILEIGVGMGTRSRIWLDRFRALDAERGTNYYPRVKFLLGDYSLATLDRSRPALKDHLDLCSFIVLDALDPGKTLAFLRHKILHIHLTNVYDNLPDEEFARRHGRLHLVQVRAYLPDAEAARIGQTSGVPVAQLNSTIHRLLEAGPEFLGDRARGVTFWQEIWKAMRLEERLVCLEDLPDVDLPAGLNPSHLEEVLENASSDFRFHMSSGALESFRNTLPLLHPRGFLQVQDIFVTNLHDYRLGFHGPGKLDGSIVNWVNGVLLREVGERAGYDVHFAPFRYREGSRTSILYTTQRE
ncbi:MAG: hypothetical protein ACRD59_10155 [Candidatus Acidiferrales bacterium]